jgi:hypothetical protein
MKRKAEDHISRKSKKKSASFDSQIQLRFDDRIFKSGRLESQKEAYAKSQP